MGFIYKIQSDIDDKVYIGKTEISIEERWNQHKKDYKRECYKHRPIYKAMKKYGVEHFFISQIDECDDSDKLCDLESFYIEQYNSFDNGYNRTLGGLGKSYVDKELIVSTYKNCQNIEEVYRRTGVTQKTIRRILKSANVEILPTKKVLSNSYGVKLHMCVKDTGEIINTFDSLSDAYRFLISNGLTNCKELGIRHHIATCLNGTRKTACGFGWTKA